MTMTNDPLRPSNTNWSAVVSRGLQKKVPPPLRRIDNLGFRENYTSETLFEDPDISSYLRNQRVLSIVNTAIEPGAVIFSFPRKLFEHQTAAYQLILDKLGPVVGNFFNPVSLRGSRSISDLVFYTKFREPAVTEKALLYGVMHNGVQYKAIPYKDKVVANNHIRVYLSLNVCEETDELIAKLASSMSHYGKVLQIKRLLNRGFFEGEVSVLLDRENGSDGYQDLQRMLYLEEWDTFAPASFKGAQQICFYCRKTGHVKKDCRTLANTRCNLCNEYGHTQRMCRIKDYEQKSVSSQPDSSFNENLDEYIKVSSQLSSQQKEKDSQEVKEVEIEQAREGSQIIDDSQLWKGESQLISGDSQLIAGEDSQIIDDSQLWKGESQLISGDSELIVVDTQSMTSGSQLIVGDTQMTDDTIDQSILAGALNIKKIEDNYRMNTENTNDDSNTTLGSTYQSKYAPADLRLSMDLEEDNSSQQPQSTPAHKGNE